ncbi:uncharacterized protein LOC136082992 [Hydra vulgaris]|uniref:Uncharacterized protein LOC136082992 n=1 Tax=Hydra vulgaris TaxID=6087 RepID=A0ABM4C9Z6_HYDVU
MPKQQWDPEFGSEIQSRKLLKRSRQCSSSSSEEELQPSKTVMHKSLPLPPCPRLNVPLSPQVFGQRSASTTLPDIVKHAVAEAVRPFFQSVFKQLEELKAEIKEQGQKQAPIGQTMTANLPEALTFPLQEIYDLLEFNRILMEDSEQRSKTTELFIIKLNIPRVEVHLSET